MQKEKKKLNMKDKIHDQGHEQVSTQLYYTYIIIGENTH